MEFSTWTTKDGTLSPPVPIPAPGHPCHVWESCVCSPRRSPCPSRALRPSGLSLLCQHLLCPTLAVPGVPAVRLCGHLPVRVLHQGLHDGGGAADPHLRAQVRLRLDSPVLHRALSYRLRKWGLCTATFPPTTASPPALPGKRGPGDKGRVEGRGIPAPAQPGCCCVPYLALSEPCLRGFNEK